VVYGWIAFPRAPISVPQGEVPGLSAVGVDSTPCRPSSDEPRRVFDGGESQPLMRMLATWLWMVFSAERELVCDVLVALSAGEPLENLHLSQG